MARSSRARPVRGHLLGAVIVSALAWWLLGLTGLPAVAAAWLAGLVAGLAAVSVLSAAHRAVNTALAASAPAPAPARSRRSQGGAR